MKKIIFTLFLIFILACTPVQVEEPLPQDIPTEKQPHEPEQAEPEEVKPEEAQPVPIEKPQLPPVNIQPGGFKLTAEKSDNSVKLSWTKYEGEMKYYKVVRSTIDATPTYDEEGYIKTISDPEVTEYVDKSPRGGINYYAVTVVLPLNKYIDSNPVTIEFPDPDETPDQKIIITAERTDAGILLKWTKYEGEFLQYKIVRSIKNPFPKYPNDRLIKTIPFVDTTEYLDILVEPGINYYAVTIIRPDKSKFTSNSVSIV